MDARPARNEIQNRLPQLLLPCVSLSFLDSKSCAAKFDSRSPGTSRPAATRASAAAVEEKERVLLTGNLASRMETRSQEEKEEEGDRHVRRGMERLSLPRRRQQQQQRQQPRDAWG